MMTRSTVVIILLLLLSSCKMQHRQQARTWFGKSHNPIVVRTVKKSKLSKESVQTKESVQPKTPLAFQYRNEPGSIRGRTEPRKQFSLGMKQLREESLPSGISKFSTDTSSIDSLQHQVKKEGKVAAISLFSLSAIFNLLYIFSGTGSYFLFFLLMIPFIVAIAFAFGAISRDLQAQRKNGQVRNKRNYDIGSKMVKAGLWMLLLGIPLIIGGIFIFSLVGFVMVFLGGFSAYIGLIVLLIGLVIRAIAI